MNLNKTVCLVMAEVLESFTEDLREEHEFLSGRDVDDYMRGVVGDIKEALEEEREARGVYCLGEVL